MRSFLIFLSFFWLMSSFGQSKEFDRMVAEMTSGTIPFIQPEQLGNSQVILDARPEAVRGRGLGASRGS